MAVCHHVLRHLATWTQSHTLKIFGVLPRGCCYAVKENLLWKVGSQHTFLAVAFLGELAITAKWAPSSVRSRDYPEAITPVKPICNDWLGRPNALAQNLLQNGIVPTKIAYIPCYLKPSCVPTNSPSPSPTPQPPSRKNLPNLGWPRLKHR